MLISNDPASVAIAPDSAVAISLGDTLVFRGGGAKRARRLGGRVPHLAHAGLDGRALFPGDGRAIAPPWAPRAVVTVGSRADTALARVTNVPAVIEITLAARLTIRASATRTSLPVTVSNARGPAPPRGQP